MHAVLALAALAGISAAQTTTSQLPYSIDPNSVSLSTRQYWCQQNQAQCPLICLQQPGVQSQTTENNDCSADALTYTCVCDNGVSPNITQYSQTLPFFICQEWGNQCVKGCNGASSCADDCRSKHPCGAQDPYKGNPNASASLASASAAAATSSFPSIGGATGSSKPGGNAASSFMPGATLGLAGLASSIFFGFALLL